MSLSDKRVFKSTKWTRHHCACVYRTYPLIMHRSVWKLPSSRFCVNGINGKRFYLQECHSTDQEIFFFYKPRSLEVPLASVKASQMRHKLQVTTETGNGLLKVFPCTSSAILRNTGCCCFWLLLAPWKLWRCEVWSLKRPHLFFSFFFLKVWVTRFCKPAACQSKFAFRVYI